MEGITKKERARILLESVMQEDMEKKKKKKKKSTGNEGSVASAAAVMPESTAPTEEEEVDKEKETAPPEVFPVYEHAKPKNLTLKTTFGLINCWTLMLKVPLPNRHTSRMLNTCWTW